MNLPENTGEHYLCEYQGCENRASEYCYPIIDPDGEDYPIVYYCDEHAAENGFCIGCHWFCEGIEDFDSYGTEQPKGYCSECWGQWVDFVETERYWKYYDPCFED